MIVSRNLFQSVDFVCSLGIECIEGFLLSVSLSVI